VIKGYGTTEGTGGSFSFYELGETLFNDDGNLNETVGAKKIREYIWYSETRASMAMSPQNDNPYLLGNYNDTAYYFYYEPEKITTLSHDTLNIISEKAETYVVYADQCVIDKEWLSAHNIIFKKIPRDISRF
jgi:adenine-specific DNA-methyltransferase